MNIIITSKNFKVNQTHKDYISKKLELLTKLDRNIYQIRVELDADKKERDGNKFRVEVWVEGKHHVKAGSMAKNLYSAVDTVLPKVKRQLSNLKDRIVEKHS